MPYGIQTFAPGSVMLIDDTKKRARLVSSQTVSVLSNVSNPTAALAYSIPAQCTSSNSVAILTSGSYALITSPGVATVYGAYVATTTTLKIYQFTT
jgi:hypothetical protein